LQKERVPINIVVATTIRKELSMTDVSIAAPCVPVIAALMCTTKTSVDGVRILDLLGLQ
jgi:hypothetical protein